MPLVVLLQLQAPQQLQVVGHLVLQLRTDLKANLAI